MNAISTVVYLLVIFADFCFVKAAIQGCETAFQACQFLQWEQWQSCSVTCGGGTRQRNRPMCCWPFKQWHGPHCVVARCWKQDSEFHETGACNTNCLNDGIYTNGGCECSLGFQGSCCESFSKLKLYYGYKYTRPCMINRIWGLKQQWLQVNGIIDFICMGTAELFGTRSERKIQNENKCIQRDSNPRHHSTIGKSAL